MIKKIIYHTWLLVREFLYKRKISKIYRFIKPGSLPPRVEKDYLLLWKWTGVNQSLFYPRVYSNISSIISHLYVPENVYYNRIEPVLNNRVYTSAYADKNFYEKYLYKFRGLFPDTIMRYINGVFYDKDYNQTDPEKTLPVLLQESETYIIKPATETSGGAGFALLVRGNGNVYLNGTEYPLKKIAAILIKEYPVSFVLQKKIRQHPWFEGFNLSSVNTVRMFTYRSVADNKVHLLQSVIRFGREGSVVDNQAAGGLSCGLNQDGIVSNFAIDKKGFKYTASGYLNKVQNTRVPFFDLMKQIVLDVAPEYYHHRLLGFDVCCDISGAVKILEVNCKNIEINFLQMNNGPLFGEKTSEIIDFCMKNKRSVVFDYRI